MVLRQCIDKGMLSGKRQAIDSALIKANASMDTLVEKQILDDAAVYTDELEANTEGDTKTTSINTPIEPPKRSKSNGYRKGEKRNNGSHFSISDPDARITGKPGKPFRMYYRSQVSVDTESYIITNIEATLGDRADSRCLQQVLEHTVSNLKDNGLEVEEVLADSGYSSTTNFEILKELAIEGYFSVQNRTKAIIPNGFTYDPTNDRYMCPMGSSLYHKRTKTKENNWILFYRAPSKDCGNCPIRSECCSPKAKIKEIERGIGSELTEEMLARMKTTFGRKMKGLRSATVEPVIGTLVNYMGMGQINTKGIRQANKCMLMAAIAYNLKKLLNFNTKTELTTVATALKSKVRPVIIDVFYFIFHRMSMNTVWQSSRSNYFSFN